MPADAFAAVEAVYRSDWGRIVATLIGILGDFDLAEETAGEALLAAVEQWPAKGVPDNPRAWLVQTAHHKAIDRLRRQRRFEEKVEVLGRESPVSFSPDSALDLDAFPDDRLRLIFTCCHPALPVESQVALTLRTLCGLETEEISRAFLLPVPTVAQRIVRAKKKIRDARIPYVVPQPDELPSRLEGVLTAIYLVFNEGYSATSGASLIRTDLCAEAMHLGRLVRSLLAPVPPEATGLLALMLLQDSRRHARRNEAGDLILLEDQDRSLWDRGQIDEALPLVTDAIRAGPGPYTLQAAIAAVHCQAATIDDTDWRQIVRLYDFLEQIQPSPVVLLNRAVAVAMVEGPARALELIDTSNAARELDRYHLLHAVRADLLRRLNRFADAADNYRRALALVTNASERRFLERRLSQVTADAPAVKR